MKFEELIAAVADEPVFETGLLLARPADAGNVRRQLSRWVRGGKVHQMRRGLYALATPEKALLDSVYLQPGGDDATYLRELRLDFGALDLDALDRAAARYDAPKATRAARRIRELAAATPAYDVL